MDRRLTLLELGRFDTSRQTLVFGVPFETLVYPDGRSLAAFLPGQTLGYERWKANAHGTTSWQFYILKTGGAGRLNAVPGVHPAAEILFRTRGKDATQRALRWLRALRRKGQFRPQDIADHQWRLVANARHLRDPYPLPETLVRSDTARG